MIAVSRSRRGVSVAAALLIICCLLLENVFIFNKQWKLRHLELKEAWKPFMNYMHLYDSIGPASFYENVSQEQYYNVSDLSERLASIVVEEEKDESSSDPICQSFDFAVTGFAKTGSTSLRTWLHGHAEVAMPKGEVLPNRIARNPRSVASMIQQIVSSKNMTTENNNTQIRALGYECPNDMWSANGKSLNFFRTRCPRTKLIVAIRHPVLWFESFYNYRLLKKEMWSIKGDGDPNALIGEICAGKGAYVCSNSGAFHKWLALMKKTDLSSSEVMLMDEYRDEISASGSMDRVRNPLFLIETSQLSDPDPIRRQHLQQDMQLYLGLTIPLSPVPHANSQSDLAHKKRKNKNLLARKMDICNANNTKIRNKMMEIATNASLWIQQYLLPQAANDVILSSPDRFMALMDGWRVDPCIERRGQQRTS